MEPSDERAFQMLVESSRSTLLGKEVFIVEGDMVFESRQDLREYYDELQTAMSGGLVNKAVVNLSGRNRDVRADSTPSTPVRDFTYCFAGGNWGTTVDLDSDGKPDDFDGDGVAEIMPTIASVRKGLELGMRAWEGVARIKFMYMQSSDGAGCATSGASFRVALDPSSSCTATGPFPSRATQALTIPRCGLSELLAMHELGHTIGFRHEHIHSNASPRCSEGDTNFEELFPDEYDGQSTMVYANCNTGNLIGGFRLSRLDGMGARILYGNPDWWASL